MGSLNQYSVIGNLAADPTLRTTKGGKKVSNFRLAINEVTRNDKDEKVEIVTWVSCTAWDHVAEFVAAYLKKGSQVYVDGKLRNQPWEKKVVAPKSGEEFTVKMDASVLIVSKVVPSYYDKDATIDPAVPIDGIESDDVGGDYAADENEA